MDPDAPREGRSSFKIPPIVNPPPQIFGQLDAVSYEADYFPENEGFDAAGSLDESNDAKRRRIARACDACRRKKIKCDGKQPACSHCINYKTECIFTAVEKKRNPPKGAKYIEGLENRLGRMETLLRISGLLNEEDGSTDLGTLERKLADKAAVNIREERPNLSPRTSSTLTQGVASNGSNRQSPTEDTRQDRPNGSASSAAAEAKAEHASEDVEHLSDMMCSLVTNNCGESKYIGSSSGFSIFSPKGIQWVNEKTGDISFQQMVSAAAVDDKWMYWKPDVFGDIFTRRKYVPLPPLHETLSLLKDYFDNFNCMFPLFHEPTFMHLVQRHYSRDPYHGSGWWASLNIALAIAHRLRVMSNLVPLEEDNKAWSFLKNALGVFSELTLKNTDLLSVQALLGMALFLQGTPNPQPSFFLVAAALRLAHSIGLHKRGSGFRLNPVEVEQRKRVFWIAYMLDKDICIRSGRPPVQDDDDMNVDLPSEDPGDNIGNIPLADGKGKTNLFRSMCTFAIIESKVYRQLYSTKASKQSDGELLNTIGELDKELEDWKESIPMDFRPEHEIKASHTPLILHVVVLHFAYYNCLTTIHRMSVHHGYWTSRLSNYAIQGLNARPLNPRVFASAALCVQAARSSIQLVRYIPQGDFACVWMTLYYPVSSLVTLFANVLQNPQDARSRSDLRLMSQVVTFLSSLAEDEEGGAVKRMHDFCSEFERIAKLVIEKADKDAHSRRKRKSTKDPADEPIPPLVASTKRPSPFSSGDPALRSPSSTTVTADVLRPGLANDMLAAPASSGYPSPDSTGTPVQPPRTSPHLISPTTSLPPPPPAPMTDFMPGPGDFPNMLTEFSDMQSFGHPGLRDGGVGIAGMGATPSGPTMDAKAASSATAAGFPQGYAAPDLWQMPMMSFDYDWNSMQLDPFALDPLASGPADGFEEPRP